MYDEEQKILQQAINSDSELVQDKWSPCSDEKQCAKIKEEEDHQAEMDAILGISKNLKPAVDFDDPGPYLGENKEKAIVAEMVCKLVNKQFVCCLVLQATSMETTSKKSMIFSLQESPPETHTLKVIFKPMK